MPQPDGKTEDAPIIKPYDSIRQLFAAVLHSRSSSLTEWATLLRFQPGTAGFQRQYLKLLSRYSAMEESYIKSAIESLPTAGLRICIFDDSPVKKAGKNFPKQVDHYDHTTKAYYSGMEILATMLYQAGKVVTISTELVGKEDNKLKKATDSVEHLIVAFHVGLFLFDCWYCKPTLIEAITKHSAIWISKLRRNTIAIMDDDTPLGLENLAMNLRHKDFLKLKINGKVYWVYDVWLNLKSYGLTRVIISKDKRNAKPKFFATNSNSFTTKFILSLYLKRFTIEVYFKDVKQFLHIEKFFCRAEEKWKLHLLLTNILHWCIQRRNSISKAVRSVRQNLNACILFINENPLLNRFLAELKRIGQT